MAIPKELDDRVEKEMSELATSRYRRAGIAYNRFTKELASLIVQAKEVQE